MKYTILIILLLLLAAPIQTKAAAYNTNNKAVVYTPNERKAQHSPVEKKKKNKKSRSLHHKKHLKKPPSNHPKPYLILSIIFGSLFILAAVAFILLLSIPIFSGWGQALAVVGLILTGILWLVLFIVFFSIYNKKRRGKSKNN